MIGGGFAGLAADPAPRRARRWTVTLVDQHNFHTFQPLLYQVATAGLEPADIAYPVRTDLRARAQRDLPPRPGRRRSTSTPGAVRPRRRRHTRPTTTWSWPPAPPRSSSGSPGRAEHARPLYTLGDARRLRNHLLATLEAADAHPEDFDDGRPGVRRGGRRRHRRRDGRARWSSSSTSASGATGCASTPSAPGWCSSTPATGVLPAFRDEAGRYAARHAARPRRRGPPRHAGGRGDRPTGCASPTASG